MLLLRLTQINSDTIMRLAWSELRHPAEKGIARTGHFLYIVEKMERAMGRGLGSGEFEQAVLIAVLRLKGSGYGVSIRRELCLRLDRDISFGAVYATLERLEGKGYLSSRLGEATPERGGKAKRLYRIEAPGQRALEAARSRAATMWSGIPKGALA